MNYSINILLFINNVIFNFINNVLISSILLNMRYELNIQELKNHINDWVTEFISPSFNFREHQFETIVDICKNILEGINHTQILEAPTGSGKSLLNIISAGVLAKYYEVRTKHTRIKESYK